MATFASDSFKEHGYFNKSDITDICSPAAGN
jgi:hypothetical protein